MISIDNCDVFSQHVGAYVEGALTQEDVYAIEVHLEHCRECQAGVKRYRAVKGLVEYVQLQPNSKPSGSKSSARRRAISKPALPALEVAQQSDELALPASSSPGWATRLGAAPWWLVSCTLHVLLIALASLVTMAIEMPHNDDTVIMITELQQRAAVAQAQEKKPTDIKDALANKETPPTDLNSKESSDIVVPPDILAKAELGDHFETINPELADTHSALGNPEARMFHSVEGNTDAAGGGGMGGIGLDDVIGVGGAASPGSGGGWGGGDGTGIGIGKGAGTGSFGNRNGGGRKLMVMRHGGSRATEGSVDKALEWLAYHQEPDGHWDVAKYSGEKGGDTALTGLALLAFLGAGHSEKVGGYKDNVRRGVEWLRKKQKDNGCYASPGETQGYNHAMAGLAMAEAAGMARIPETTASAQKAVMYSVEHHQLGDGSEKKGWRYAPKEGKGDLSNSGWFIMQLKSAKVAGLHVPPEGFEGAAWFLDHVEDKTFGKDADNAYDNGRHRYGYSEPSKAEVMARPMRTAIGCLCREFLGTSREELAGGVEWFVNTPGNRGGGLPSKDKVNLYYWYYGTLCTFQQGGDVWKKWNEALKPCLLEMQCKDGDNAGSWDPEHTPGAGMAWGQMWGRVGQTALSALCLEVYYRYALLNK